MEFKRTLTSRATIKKQKEYEFEDLTESQISDGRKRKYDNPLFIRGKFNDYLLYSEKRKLIVTMLHSYDKFEEIKGAVGQESVKEKK